MGSKKEPQAACWLVEKIFLSLFSHQAAPSSSSSSNLRSLGTVLAKRQNGALDKEEESLLPMWFCFKSGLNKLNGFLFLTLNTVCACEDLSLARQARLLLLFSNYNQIFVDFLLN